MTDPKRGAFNGLLALLRPFRTIVSVSVALGMAGGLAITFLLATINNALHSSTGMTQGVVLTCAALCVLALTSSIVSDIGTKVIVVGPGNRQGKVTYNDRGVDFFGNLFGFGG